MTRQRKDFDQVILDWSATIDPAWLEGDLSYFSGAANRQITKPRWLLVTHLFNHQTYHLGQISMTLQRYGIDPPNFDALLVPEGA